MSGRRGKAIPSTAPARVTVLTVAKAAGVSATTVSRVMNGKGEGISKGVQDRVIAVARRLNYRPSSLAVSLRTKATQTIGLIVPDISDAYFHLLARGVEDTAQAAGYVIVICNTDREPKKEVLCLDRLLDRQVDGIIFAGGGVDEDRHLQKRQWGHTKALTLGPHRLPFPSVRPDNEAAIAAVVSYLTTRGRRRIAAIGGSPGWLIHQERLEGYKRGLRDAGAPVDKSLVWDGAFTIDAGRLAVRHALERGIRFDAVVAFNDYSAIGALQELQSHGIAVPERVAVTGCDDIPMAALVTPPLTTIAFPLYEFGATAARTMLAMLRGEAVPNHTTVPFTIEVRSSSDQAAVHSA